MTPGAHDLWAPVWTKKDYAGAQKMIVIIMTDPQNDLWITRERERERERERSLSRSPSF